MSEQIFISDDGTLTKADRDEYIEDGYVPDGVRRIGFRSKLMRQGRSFEYH